MGNRKKNKYFVIILVLICTTVFFIVNYSDYEETTVLENASKEELLCYNFLKNKLSSPKGGIYTNYLSNNEIKDYSSGHEILSESIGLFMLFLIEKDMPKEFDKQFNYLKNYMINSDGLVKWRIDEETTEKEEISATIDDLRIIRALLLAYEQWQNKKYILMAMDISNSVYKYNTKDGILYNYKVDNTCNVIDLSYLDLFTMKKLMVYDERWEEPYLKSIEILKNGQLSSELPLYEKTFNIKEKNYCSLKEINSIDSMLVLLHLTEVGLEDIKAINWVRNEIKKKKRILSYYSLNGNNSLDEESTAVYGIVARIGNALNDNDLKKMAINRMKEFQVLDEKSEIYGSFGNPQTLKVYSFDNLQALIALSK